MVNTPIANKTSPSLMIKASDIGELAAAWQNVPAWVKAHTLPGLPPHRYRGELAIEESGLIFRGTDVKEGKDYEEFIPFGNIKEVFLETVERLKRSFDAFPGGALPLAITYERNHRPETVYLHTDFNRYPTPRNYPNQEWYDLLKVKLVTCRPTTAITTVTLSRR